MKARHLLYSLNILLAIVFCGCEHEELENVKKGEENEIAQKLVAVPCKINVTPFGYDTGDTTEVKAEDYTSDEMQIKDFWLIQFDGDGKLLASVYHAPELVNNYVQMNDTDNNIANTKTVWIVANTGDATGLATGSLQDQLRATRQMMGNAQSATDLEVFEKDGYKFTTNSESSIASLNREDGAILMSGKCSFEASDLYNPYPDGTPNYDVAKNGLEVTISSMVAKLTINYKIGEDYTLDAIKLFRIPDRCSFAKKELEGGITDYKLLLYEYQIPNSGKTVFDGVITIYVPQNLQEGNITNDDGFITKTHNAPPKATYISFGLSKSTEKSTKKVSVNVFSGGDEDLDPNSIDSKDNQYNSYKIWANTHYTEQVVISKETINGYLEDNLTNSETRVIEKLQQKITSNCYILNPLTNVKETDFHYSNLREEYYALPVVARVNEAWYGQNNANMIGKDDEWMMEVIWQDVPGRQVFFSESSGLKGWKNEYGHAVENKGNDLDNNLSYASIYYGRGNGENGFVNIYVKKESQTVRTRGNVLIGLRKKTGTDNNGENTYGDILWSWHLWVTDYNPDAAGEWKGGDIYNYNVPGDTDNSGTRDAKVFHYKFWTTGNNYNYDWIMDRHLGALGWRPAGMFDLSKNPAEHEAFGLYYQWGRKDPFPAQRLLNNRFYQNKTPNPAGYSNYRVSEIKLYTIAGEQNNISIRGSEGLPENGDIFNTTKSPTQLFNVSDITLYDGKNWNMPEGKGWPDGTEDTKIVGAYGGVQGSKTLFDPCPAGWELPQENAYLGSTRYPGFVKSTTSNLVSNINGQYATTFHEIEAQNAISGVDTQEEVNNGGWEIRTDGSGNANVSPNIHYNCNNDTRNENSTYYPCSGWLTSGGQKDMQGIGDVWCVTQKNGVLGSYLYIGRGVGKDFNSSGHVIYVNYPVLNDNKTDIGYDKNNGFSVRCVKKK